MCKYMHEKGVKTKWKYPPRYKDENGKQESDKSYITFLTHFIYKKPRPTIEEVSENSGYKINTVRHWFYENKYIQRYTEHHTQKTEEEQDFKQQILQLTEEAITLDSNSGNSLRRKTHHEIQKHSTDNNNPSLENLEIQDPLLQEIRKMQIENQQNTNRTLEAIKEYDNINIDLDKENIEEKIQQIKEARDELRKESFKIKRQQVEQEYEEIPWE